MANENWPAHNIALAVVESMKRHERKPADVYPTPGDCTEALLKALMLPRSLVVEEPCCGDGAIARVLRHKGHTVIARDLRHTGYGEGGVDFLTTEGEVPAIITNPPFDIAADFIMHALERAPLVALLLKSNYWNTSGRASLFEAFPPTIEYKLTWRPAFLAAERGKNPLMDCNWYVWRRGAPRLPFRPLRRPVEFLDVSRPLISSLLVQLREAVEENMYVRSQS